MAQAAYDPLSYQTQNSVNHAGQSQTIRLTADAAMAGVNRFTADAVMVGAKFAPQRLSSDADAATQMCTKCRAESDYGGRDALERLARLVKAFQGDVYGDALWCCPALMANPSHSWLPPETGVFRCRLSPDSVLMFLAVLRVDYAVIRQENASGAYSLYLPSGQRLPMDLQITIMSRREWGLTGADFDIDMLAMDAHRVYVRPCAQQRLPHLSDPFSYLLGRLKSRVFCLTDGGRTLQQNQRAMARAYAMVRNGGWRMDDSVLGDKGWVIARAQDVAHSRLQFRGHFSVDECRELPTCALCRESIRVDDVVAHLTCGHAFHYVCQPAAVAHAHAQSGLSGWLDTDTGSTCPCCRAVI
jgi:hypothetical protein